MSEALFPTIRVHCFTCPFSVVGFTPDEAHGLMEAHYSKKHIDLIRSLIWNIG